MAHPVPAPPAGWRGLDRRQREVLVATIAANAVVFFDQTAVTVALPAIGRDLGGDAVVLPWVITSYLAALAIFMVVAGRIADRFGRRRTFLAGLALFAAGCMLCASAPSIELLVAARFVQGVGGAIVAPLALSNTTRAVGDAERGWAIGMFAAGGTTLLVFGPLLAGLLLEVASWRWVFLVTLPVLAAAWVLARRAITPSRGAADAPGAARGALRDPLLIASLAALFAIQFAVFAATIPLTLYLQHGLRQSAVVAGVLIALAGIGTPLLSVAAGRVADRRGPRTLVVGGLVLATAGLALVAALAPLGGVVVLVPGLVAFALARPAVFTPAGTGPFLALGDGQRAFAASLGTEARQCGAVLGAGVAGAVFAAVNGSALVDGDVTQVAGFAAATLVAAAVCATAAVLAWRWLPRTSARS
jgi:MFS family permease